MPRFHYLGRYWATASDDFVLPSVCHGFFRLAVGVALGVTGWFVFTHSVPTPAAAACTFDGFDIARVYIYATVGVLAAGVLADVATACSSSSGSIVDDRPRRHLPKYLSVNLLLGFVEGVLALVGLYAVWLGRSGRDSSCAHSELDSDAELWTAMRAACVTHNVLFLLRICLMGFSFRGNQMPVERRIETWHETHKDRHQASCARGCYFFLCCCTRSGRADVFDDVGGLMADAFESQLRLDLTASDVVAGLALLRAVQKQEENDVIQGKLRRKASRRDPGTGAAAAGGASEGVKHHSQAVPGSVTAGRDVDDRNVIAEASHYSTFARGVYGWMMYVWSRPLSGFCRIGGHCMLAGCTSCGGNSAVSGDTCTCNQSAMELQTGIAREDILLSDFSNSEACDVAFAVVRDRRRRALVVCCRGTLSFNDVLTDGLAEGEDLRTDPDVRHGAALGLPDTGAAFVHRGMWDAAKNIRAAMINSGVLRALQPGEFHSFVPGRHAGSVQTPLLDDTAPRLIFCGHSLGAGVSCCLALLFRMEVPGLRCWAFACPGAVMSEPLAELMEPNITSVVLGKDMIPRLSLPTVRSLGEDMIELLGRADMPKWQLLRGWICCCFRCGSRGGRQVEKILGKDAELPQTRFAKALTKYRETKRLEVEAGLDRRPQFDLVLPGRVLHIVKVRTSRQSCCSKVRRYRPLWADRRLFRERILISTLMIEDHMPDRLDNVLAGVVEQNTRRTFRRMSEMSSDTTDVSDDVSDGGYGGGVSTRGFSSTPGAGFGSSA